MLGFARKPVLLVITLGTSELIVIFVKTLYIRTLIYIALSDKQVEQAGDSSSAANLIFRTGLVGGSWWHFYSTLVKRFEIRETEFTVGRSSFYFDTSFVSQWRGGKYFMTRSSLIILCEYNVVCMCVFCNVTMRLLRTWNMDKYVLFMYSGVGMMIMQLFRAKIQISVSKTVQKISG